MAFSKKRIGSAVIHEYSRAEACCCTPFNDLDYIMPEEVGHGHVTYARTRFSMEISVQKALKCFFVSL